MAFLAGCVACDWCVAWPVASNSWQLKQKMNASQSLEIPRFNAEFLKFCTNFEWARFRIAHFHLYREMRNRLQCIVAPNYGKWPFQWCSFVTRACFALRLLSSSVVF